MKRKINSNTPIYNTDILEYDVICPECGRKEILKTKIKGMKRYTKTCRNCKHKYKVDITKLSTKNLNNFMYWLETL